RPPSSAHHSSSAPYPPPPQNPPQEKSAELKRGQVHLCNCAETQGASKNAGSAVLADPWRHSCGARKTTTFLNVPVPFSRRGLRVRAQGHAYAGADHDAAV